MRWVHWVSLLGCFTSLLAADGPQDCFRALPLKQPTLAQYFDTIHGQCQAKTSPCDCLDEARLELLLGNSARAVQILEPLCESGQEKHACFLWGVQLASKRRYELAVDAFSRSCKVGVKDSCDQEISIRGLLDKIKETQHKLQASCDGGKEDDCKLLATLMEEYEKANKPAKTDKALQKFEEEIRGYFAKKDVSPRATTAFQAACSKGLGVGCEYFGRSRETAGEKEEAIVFYRKACELKHADGCVLLGNILAFNDRVPEAKETFQRGCELESTEGCLNLARLELLDGSQESAKRLFRVVCESSAKEGKGCLELASAEEKEGNRGLAKLIYQRTCEKKVGEACVRWGVMEKAAAPAPTRNPWFKDPRR